MKKLLFTVAMFMLVCGSTVAVAQNPVKTQPETEQTSKDNKETKEEAPKEETKEASADEKKAAAETSKEAPAAEAAQAAK